MKGLYLYFEKGAHGQRKAHTLVSDSKLFYKLFGRKLLMKNIHLTKIQLNNTYDKIKLSLVSPGPAKLVLYFYNSIYCRYIIFQYGFKAGSNPADITRIRSHAKDTFLGISNPIRGIFWIGH